MDMLLAFKEQEKPSATAPSSARHHRSAEPLHPQIDEEHDQSGTGNFRFEELGLDTPLRSQDQGEEPQEQQQQEEVAVEAMREGEDDSDYEEREPQGEKHQYQGNDEISRNNYHLKNGDCSYNTSDEDDEDLRPAKRRKLPPTRTSNALTLPDEPTPVDNDYHHAPRTSRSPSIIVESASIAEYQEWPCQGFLKRTKIGNKTIYNLEFQLSHIPKHLRLPILSEALGMHLNKETSAEAVTSHDAGTHSKMHSAAVRPRIKRVRWESEDATILKMREDGYTWEEIHAALPHRTKDAI